MSIRSNNIEYYAVTNISPGVIGRHGLYIADHKEIDRSFYNMETFVDYKKYLNRLLCR